MSVRIEWEGEQVLEVTRKEVNAALEAGAKRIAAKAAAAAPSAIPVVAKRRKGASNITGQTARFDVIAGRGEHPSGKPGVSVPAHIEYGTRRTAPRPFMWPAFDAEKGSILSELENTV